VLQVSLARCGLRQELASHVISSRMASFFQLTLRTLDVDAARVFYASLLGTARLHVVQLHEQAVARGARPHWLGYIEVADVDRAASSFIERGATPLGPKWVNPEGLEAAVMRDPGGAIVALARPSDSRVETPNQSARFEPQVVWYGLNTSDVARARTNYAELFAWKFQTASDLGELGVIHPFTWDGAAQPVGSMSDIAERTGVHPHWLFHFAVDSLASAVEAVRRAGGTVIGPLTLPDGKQVAVCDDPQGAAFALEQRG
jgi:uncharacterized protein